MLNGRALKNGRTSVCIKFLKYDVFVIFRNEGGGDIAEWEHSCVPSN